MRRAWAIPGVVLALAGCASGEAGDVSAFCAAWGSDTAETTVLLRTAPDAIDDQVGRYVAGRGRDDDTAEAEQRIDAWADEHC